MSVTSRRCGVPDPRPARAIQSSKSTSRPSNSRPGAGNSSGVHRRELAHARAAEHSAGAGLRIAICPPPTADVHRECGSYLAREVTRGPAPQARRRPASQRGLGVHIRTSADERKFSCGTVVGDRARRDSRGRSRRARSVCPSALVDEVDCPAN
jgi:hypothetical protein